MLWTVGILAFVGWVIAGLTIRDQVGPGIHILLVLSLAVFVYAFVRRSRGKAAQAAVKPTSHHSGEARSRA
jgi:hypothetical protein